MLHPAADCEKPGQRSLKGQGGIPLNEKILIVEDNPQNMRLLTMVLRGYTLVTASDGEEALAVAVQERPALIIMDMQLPRRSGFEVARLLRQDPDFGNTPIIAITAYAMKGDCDRCLEAGCNAYVPKPIDTRELPMIVAGLLKKD